jgi:iron complex outermembrane receptor protein
MERLVLGTTKATAFNPFGQAADNDPNVLKQINNGYTQINDTSQYLRQLSAKADGPLFSIAGGDVRAAIGTEFREEQAQQLQLGGTPGPNQLLVRDDNIFRTVAAVFTEVNVPLFSDANAIPGFKRFDLSLSGRYDHYQKLGGTFNPKIGAIWVPFDSVSLRGSYGTSFVAPNIGMITSIFGVPQIATNVTGYFNGANLYNMGGGNPNLTPENATTYSLGADYKPAYIPGLKLGVTYYNVEYSNLVYKPTNTEAFNNPAFAYAVTKFSTAAGQAGATAAQIAAMVAEAPPQSPVPSRIDAIFRSYAVNIGVRKISGLDLDAAYAFGTGFGDFNLSVNANRQLSYKQEVVPGSGFQSRLGFQDAIKWRARSQVSWKYDNLGISLFSTYIDSFKPIANIARVKAWTTFDLSAQYNFPNLLNGTQIQVRAANLFDKRPPFFNSGTGYYAQLASPFGQTLEVTLRTKF